MTKQCILINATAATQGGAFTVLLNLLENIVAHYQFIVFVSVDFNLLPNLDNVKYVNPRAKSYSRRIYWDNFGLNKWCIRNSIVPDLIISLQNTGVKFKGEVKQLIYYHQPIPLFSHNWRWYRKSERSLWFYEDIYPFFVKKHIYDNTKFVVQFEWIKERLHKLIKIDPSRIIAIKPSFLEFDLTHIKKRNLNGKLKIFYPASNYRYKNHTEIINAINYLEKTKRAEGIKVYFTLDRNSSSHLLKRIKRLRLENYFEFVGKLDYKAVLEYYNSSDLLVFPSFLESYGLPLVEAAKFGMKILAADMEYSREVLSDYPGASFLPLDSPKVWGDAIYKSLQSKEKFDSWEPNFSRSSWNEFFSLVDNIIRE